MAILIGGIYLIITMIFWFTKIESIFRGTEYIYFYVKYQDLILFGGYIILFVMLPFTLLFIIAKKSDSNFEKLKHDRIIKQEIFSYILEKYNVFLKNNGVNINKKVTIKKNIKGVNYYMWTQDNFLKFVNVDEIYKLALGSDPLDEYKGNENKYEEMFKTYYNDKICIPINKIYYFKLEGNVHYETKISGGDGGGSDIGGALLGGAIAGSTGAIIGSRKKTNPIKSENIEHDERSVVLKYYNDNDNLIIIKFAYYSYNHKTTIDLLEELIPEKDYNLVIKKQQNNNVSSVDIDITERLGKLTELKIKGLISEQEFNNKKEAILESL